MYYRMENQSAVTGRVIGCAITVHRVLGPRLRERVYEEALALEFLEQRIAFERQVSVPIQYKWHWVGHYQIDFIVEREVVVEVKSIDQYHPLAVAALPRPPTTSRHRTRSLGVSSESLCQDSAPL